MTPEQINIAIAEACGWKSESGVISYDGEKIPWKTWTRGNETVGDDTMPNYYSSLDAIHEAEKILTEKQWSDYLIELGAVLIDSEYSDLIPVCHATAPHRCESFLRTIGKWKEDAQTDESDSTLIKPS